MSNQYISSSIIKYPEYYFSENVDNYLNSKPKLPDAPIAPKEPSRPVDPGVFKESEESGKNGCFVFLLIAAIIGLIAILASDFDEKIAVIIPGLGLILYLWSLTRVDSWDKKSHEKRKKQYEEDSRKYTSALAEYQSKFSEYQRKKRDYELRIMELQSPNSVVSFRKNLICNWERQRESVVLFDCEKDELVKKGVAEDYFVSHLTQAGFSVLTEKKIPVGNKYYYPDIIITEGKLVLDIEIDEPYAGSDGTPIHFHKENYGIYTSIDEDRNRFFCEHGFEVIRFAEEQIFRNTNECIDFIRQYLQSIRNGIIPSLPDNISVDKWSKETASKWAYQRFRNTYVPPMYQVNISLEGQKRDDLPIENPPVEEEWPINIEEPSTDSPSIEDWLLYTDELSTDELPVDYRIRDIKQQRDYSSIDELPF